MSATSKGDNDWQRLWFATRHKAWNSLAVIPSDPGVEAGLVAEALVATGRVHGERPVALLNGQGIELSGVHDLVDTLATMTGRGDWVIVPVDPIGENPSSVPVAQAASATLLVVRLGESYLASAQATMDAVGRERFVGSVVIGSGKDGSVQLTLPK